MACEPNRGLENALEQSPHLRRSVALPGGDPRWDWQVYPTKKGQFRAELKQITLNQLWMQSFHHELPQIQIGAVIPNRKVIGFLTEVRQPAIHHRGEEVSPYDVSPIRT